MDALALLKADHRAVEEKSAKFEALGPRALKAKSTIVREVIKALSIHASIEEQYVYPAVMERLEAHDSDVLEALEEHHIVKWTLSELQEMESNDERFNAKFTVLMENVRHHVKEEESTLFPAIRKGFTRNELVELGDALLKAEGRCSFSTPPALGGRATDEPGVVVAGEAAGLGARRRRSGPPADPGKGVRLRACAGRAHRTLRA